MRSGRRSRTSATLWIAIALGILVLCCGGAVLDFIAPDEVAAFSPFNR
jgi:hypothetical protein